MRSLSLFVLLCTALAAASGRAEAQFRIETVASGLKHPWSLAWLPDGRMLVTERAGRLRIIEDGEVLPEPVEGVPQAHVAAQAGLFEVLPAPDFADSRELYLSLAQGPSDTNSLLVVRGRLEGNVLHDVEEVFRPAHVQDTSVHYGGRMIFLPDETLLITLGDGFDYREEAQSLRSHWGTVVRVARDGSVPDDNPFAGRADALPEIYSYGHRNVQGIALDAETGTVWVHEHGPRGGDELNLLEPGENYGWPLATHGIDYSGARISPFRELPGMRPPLAVWTPAIAPAGLSLYRGEAFPDWAGDLLVAGLVSRSVHRLRVEDGAVIEEERLFAELDRRLRDVRVGPDGALYLLTDHADGEILRVVPAD
jgi:aldose sugar dehydrogenase